MGMYLELSRPQGDVSRWEKVFKRLNLLNKYYPLKTSMNCETVDFQRDMETNKEDASKLYFIVRDALIDQGVVFFGGYASSLYSRYMPKVQKKLIMQIPDFDVLSEEPERTAAIVGEHLEDNGYTKIKIVKHDAIGEIIPERYEVRVGKDTLAFLYKPIACHSYNTININDKEINIASIDTMLSFYLAFIYADKPFPYFNKDRILCMSEFLFNVEQENRLEQRGLLKRFSLECYGKQPTLETIRAEKAEKFKELSGKRGTSEFEEWFLKYTPGSNTNDTKSKKTVKNVEKKKQTRKRRKSKTKFLNIF
jgi:hypothetical protein